MLRKITLIVVCAATLFSAVPVRADTGPVQRLGTGIPTSIAASPDGETLAVGSSIGVWFLDAATLTPNGFWDTGVWVNSVEYSTDGRYLKVNETVYDTAGGTPAGVDAGQVAWVNHWCSFDGRLCAKNFYHKYDPTVLVSTQILDTNTLVSIKILERSTKSVAWSMGGDSLYTVFYDWRKGRYIIKEWNIRTWQETQRLQGFFTDELEQVLWSMDSSEIASGQSVWNVTNAEITRVRGCQWYEYRGKTFSCEWPPVTTWEAVVYVYDRELGSSRKFIPHHIVLYNAVLSMDEHLLATSGRGIIRDCRRYLGRQQLCKSLDASTRIWDPISLTMTVELPTVFYDMKFSPDNNLLVGHTLNSIEVWDWKNARQLWSVEEKLYDTCYPYNCGARWHTLAVSPSGEFIATYAYPTTGKTVRLYRLTTGEFITTFTGHTASITDIAFSPDGTKVAASSLDGTILIWGVP